MNRELMAFLSGKRETQRDGFSLKILTAQQLLAAGAEAEENTKSTEALPLWRNACILARAVSIGGEPVFSSGGEVLERWSAEKIGVEMEAYRALAKTADVSCGEQEAVGRLKAALGEEPMERIRWKVLRQFHVLPSEQRAREMTEGDYLLSAMHMLLDREEWLRKLCPACRERQAEKLCPCCGKPVLGEEEVNPGFDNARFEELKRYG